MKIQDSLLKRLYSPKVTSLFTQIISETESLREKVLYKIEQQAPAVEISTINQL